MPDQIKMADAERPCTGCAHSASGAPFPGHPSGERPCGFCVRNNNPLFFTEETARWYDGKTPPVKFPMDCYISLDRLTQTKVFDALDRIAKGEQKVEPRGDGFEFYRDTGMTEAEIKGLKDIGTPGCCVGIEDKDGPTKGHSLNCIHIIGFSFG